MKHIFGALAGACLLAPFAFATTPTGNTLFIANNGLDSPTCGSATDPCRSISQGILNAQGGDRLIVKPGRYGDTDHDGVLADHAGDENGPSIPGSLGAVHIDKPLTIISSEGAEATIIDAVGGAFAVVEIAVDGVRFGDKNAGFTLKGAGQYGLFAQERTGVFVTGNISQNAPSGGFFLFSSGVIEARQNTAIGSTSGFGMLAIAGSSSSYVVVAGNYASGNSAGIGVSGIGAHRVIGNQVSGNEVGFSVNYGPYRIAQNQIAANGMGVFVSGFSSEPIPQGPLFTRNNFVGTRASALLVTAGPPGITARVRENNFLGNYGCGTNNQSDATLDARHNFWGSPSGPGSLDPADEACDFFGHPTLTTPFATSEYALK
jgi:hypothetical protein